MKYYQYHPAGHKKNNMRCEETQELIPAYIDRELDAWNNVAVETHVRACETCRGNHAEHSNLRWLIRTGAQYFKVPDDLKSRVRKQISEV
jgi:predicted anti-sigma-YlaC factor YlaD